MILTEKEVEVLDASIHKATIWQLFHCLWWSITNNKKNRILVDYLMAGMAWKFAYENAKKL
jgi:hypothetical protein